MKTIMHGAMAFGLALTLAACGGGDGDDDTDNGQVGSVPFQNNFGAGFQSAFNNGAGADDALSGGVAGAVDVTAEAIDPQASDLTALSLTTDPVAIP